MRTRRRDGSSWVSTRGDKDGETPLHEAAWEAAHRTVKLLIDRGADVNARDKHGRTPLDRALASDRDIEWSRVAVREMLLDHGGLTGGEIPGEDDGFLAELAEPYLGRPFSVDAREESVGWTDLHYAALLDLSPAVTALIEARMPADVHLKTGYVPFGDSLRRTLRSLGHWAFAGGNADGETPLMIAAARNALRAARELIARGANVNAPDEDGDTPLHYAAWHDAHDTAELLLAHGARIDTRDGGGETPLHHAAMAGSVSVVEVLLSHDAEINATNDNGHTPLDHAIAASSNEGAGLAEVRDILRDFGARTAAEQRGEQGIAGQLADLGRAHLGRPFSTHARERSTGWTDLHYAALLNLPAVAAALIDAGVAADIRLKSGSAPFGDDLKRSLDALGHPVFESWRAEGETPLMIATVAGAREAAAALIAGGADIHAQNDDGATALHVAAAPGGREMAEWLIARGADIDARDDYGETPLHYALRAGAPEVAGWLISRGAAVDAGNNIGLAPLHRAAETNAHEAAELLIAGGAAVDVKDVYGETPLLLAVSANALEAVERLVAGGADIHAKGHHGATLLHHAAFANALETAQWLVAQGIDIEAKDDVRATPLHGATLGNALETAQWLVAHGADIAGTDDDGATPLHLAAYGGALETAQWLIDRGADFAAQDRRDETPRDYAWKTTTGDYPRRHALRYMLEDLEEGVEPQGFVERERAAILAEHGTEHVGRPFSPDAREDSAGWTDLHYAALLDLDTVVRALVDGGMAVDPRLAPDSPSLGDALVETLEALGHAGVEDRIAGGETPLMLAALVDARDAARTLMDRAADIGARGSDGRTPLHHAASGNALEVAALLLARGADANTRDLRERTPLDEAIDLSAGDEESRAAMRSLLRRHGARTASEQAEAAEDDGQARPTFRDCAGCPEMVVLPAGSFTMGSPSSEEARLHNEGPQHPVTIPAPFAVGRHEVTWGEFSDFVEDTGRSMGRTCETLDSGLRQDMPHTSWRDPGYRQGRRDPVVCVSWSDALAYAAWLSRKTGKPYRLLSA